MREMYQEKGMTVYETKVAGQKILVREDQIVGNPESEVNQ